MLRDCTAPATRLSCSLEPVPGRTRHPSSKHNSLKAGDSPEEIFTSDYDSGDRNLRVDRVSSDLSDPSHDQGADGSPDTLDSEDIEIREALDPGTLSEQIKLLPINCERAKYIEVIQFRIALHSNSILVFHSDRHCIWAISLDTRCLNEYIAAHNSS